MKREWAAGALLLLLCLGAWLHVGHIDALTGTVSAGLERSQQAADRGDTEAALAALAGARAVWDRERTYTGVFLGHQERDSLCDAFLELEAALRRGEDPRTAYERLRFRLEELGRMEHLRLGSVL